MKRIIMKKTASKFSNPAKNVVLRGADDPILSDYIREISKYPALSAKEEKECAKLAQEGDAEAKKKLIQANLKLVFLVAKKAIFTSSLPMTDLVQEGNLGVMIAAEKFNYKLGYKFATYASWWIKQSMFKAISEQSHCMKIPVYIQETLSKFSKMKAQMEREYNCQIKTKDVAGKMNIEPEKIDNFLSAYSKSISLEGGIEGSDGREMSLADILQDEKANVCASVEYEGLKKDIDNVVSTLKEREQDVVRMRYGLGDFTKRTLEEIGNLYGVTKECIRQTELRALKKMRASDLSQDTLSCYIY